MDNAKALIDTIDKRIDNFLRESQIICRYSGIVLDTQDDLYSVKLLGYDTIYKLPKRSYVSAQIGDFVFIESKFGNLNNGIIVDSKARE